MAKSFASRILLLSILGIWIPAVVGGMPAPQAAATLEEEIELQEVASLPPMEEGELVEPRAAVSVPEASEKAMRYYRSGNVLAIVKILWSLTVPLFLLFSGFSARLRDWATKVGKKWFFIVSIYLAIYLLIDWLLALPLAFYEGFLRQYAYDLSNQTLGKWMGDSFKELTIGLIVIVLVMWIPYWLLEKSPRRWWLYCGLGTIPLLILMMLVTPIWIDPLFNDFGRMRDKELEAGILALAERAGIEGSRVFEVNKSVDTNAVNAYVTGFSNTKRIVLWDTILRKLDADEVLFVMGHEMGHYVLRHVITFIVLVSATMLVAFYLLYRLAGGLISRYRHRFRFSQLADIASVPLLVVLLNVFFLILAPMFNAVSRHFEHESDRFGLELTHDNEAAAQAFVKLQEENLGNPRPGWIYKLWRSSHPPLAERIEFCNSYRPWETGDPQRYDDLIE